jgi:hypothetical protein
MSEQELDLTPVTERTDYPPILNAAVPALMLVVSLAYAWSLRDIVNPQMNLLLLRPLFVVIWVLLLIVIVKDVVPSIRLHREWSKQATQRSVSWQERFAPGTEAGAGLVVLATFLFSIFGPGDLHHVGFPLSRLCRLRDRRAELALAYPASRDPFGRPLLAHGMVSRCPPVAHRLLESRSVRKVSWQTLSSPCSP